MFFGLLYLGTIEMFGMFKNSAQTRRLITKPGFDVLNV